MLGKTDSLHQTLNLLYSLSYASPLEYTTPGRMCYFGGLVNSEEYSLIDIMVWRKIMDEGYVYI